MSGRMSRDSRWKAESRPVPTYATAKHIAAVTPAATCQRRPKATIPARTAANQLRWATRKAAGLAPKSS